VHLLALCGKLIGNAILICGGVRLMRKGLLILAVVALGLAMVAKGSFAQEADTSAPDAFSGRAVRLSGSVIGKVTLVSGTCTQGFSNQCPSGHNCSCYSGTGAKFTSSRIGRGAAAIFITVDSTASYGALGNDCQPVYGELDVIAKKDLPDFDMIGGLCTDPNGNFVFNGTMGLASSSLFVSNGYAGFTSTISGNSGRLVLRFSCAAQ
jgi:hypothetical protein